MSKDETRVNNSAEKTKQGPQRSAPFTDRGQKQSGYNKIQPGQRIQSGYNKIQPGFAPRGASSKPLGEGNKFPDKNTPQGENTVNVDKKNERNKSSEGRDRVGERNRFAEGKDNKERLNSSPLLIRRVSKTRARGRMGSMSATIVVGDGHGRGAVCSSSAKEVQEALRKARMRGEARMQMYQIWNKRTLPHDIYGKHGVVRVIARRAPSGTGIIAGDTMRAIFEAIGIKDVVAKVIKGRNPLNVAHATINALDSIKRNFLKVKESKETEGAKVIQSSENY